ncbi:MAG: hypothetical protein J6K97_00990 [Clostridia bacterium]|nr:hypothetical protein [Clostridia bacterium]
MLKKHSKIKLIIFAIIAMLGILLCVCPFSIPSSSDVFNGFIPAMNRGIDLNGGVETSYKAELKEGSTVSLDEAMEDAVTKIHALYKQERYSELYVDKIGEDKISVLMSKDANENNTLYEYLQEAKPISMTLTEASGTVTNPEQYVFGDDIKGAKVDYDYDSSSYGIKLNFTKQGKENIASLKEHAKLTSNSTVYIYMGEVKADNLLTSVDIDEVKDGMYVSNDDMSNSAYVAQETCHNIVAGSLNVSLTNLGTSAVSATLGVNAQLYIMIATAILVVLTIVLFCLRYGHLGLLGSMSVVFYLVLFCFIMQAIPFVVLNLAGVVACIVAFLIAVAANCYIFERIREEYALGKKIHISCKSGFKKSLWPILDSHIMIALASIFVWIFAPATFKVFGIALLVGAVVSVFASLVLTRYFVNLYLPINSTKANKLHLYRDKNVKEIKEDEVEIIPEDAQNSQMMEGGNE